MSVSIGMKNAWREQTDEGSAASKKGQSLGGNKTQESHVRSISLTRLWAKRTFVWNKALKAGAFRKSAACFSNGTRQLGSEEMPTTRGQSRTWKQGGGCTEGKSFEGKSHGWIQSATMAGRYKKAKSVRGLRKFEGETAWVRQTQAKVDALLCGETPKGKKPQGRILWSLLQEIAKL